MAIRLIALDIDGTLLNSRWELPPQNCAAVQAATRRGVEVALVTGRRYDFALPIAKKLEAPITMVASNGALIRTEDGVTHLRHLLPASTALAVLQATQSWRDGTAVIFDRTRENQLILERLDEEQSIRNAYFHRNRDYVGFAVPLESCLTEDPIQVLFSGGVKPMRDAEAAMRAMREAGQFKLAITRYEHRDFSMIDVLNPACSKGAALAEWARLRGILRDEILAIGDNHNDLEMLSFAGVPVVMGNAVAELKQHGWHVTGTSDDAGVAMAIEKFALHPEPQCS